MGECVNQTIEVLAIGTRVTIDAEIPATIRRIEIRGPQHDQISYECVWWDERTRKSEWLSPDELTTKESQHMPVTFVRKT